MPKSIDLQITKQGGVLMLQDDQVDLREFGQIEVTRASHVEFNNETQCWYVQSAKSLEILRSDFKTREEALSWEKLYYSPDGQGWGEIK